MPVNYIILFILLSMANWCVIKLGGTSQSEHGYNELIKLIKSNPNQGYVIVLSAISKVTNLLEKYVHTKELHYLKQVHTQEYLLRETLGLKTCDFDNYCNYTSFLWTDADDPNLLYEQSELIGKGEVISTQILADYFTAKGITNFKLASSYKFIKSKRETFKLYPSVQFYADSDAFHREIGNAQIVICQGFIASTPSHKPILLGRGGSDTTGAIIANMLNASEYQVWTDVNGIYTCDPRIIDTPKQITSIDYDIVVEIAEMGAKVMHPFSILPCAIKNIPIKIKNTFNMDAESTIIHRTKCINDSPIVIAVQTNITLFKMSSPDMWNSYGFMADIFRHFSENKIDVNIVTTSPASVYTTTDETNMITLRSVACDLETSYIVEMIPYCVIVTIVTPNVKRYANKINFADFTSHIIHFGANNMSLSFVVNEDNYQDLVKLLHITLIDQ